MSHCSPSIVALAVVIAAGLAACAEQGKLPQEATIGPDPQLPSPDKSLVPTMKVAKAIGLALGKRQADCRGRNRCESLRKRAGSPALGVRAAQW